MAPRPDVEHVVGEAEGLSRIAAQYGLFWQTIWNHPENAALRQARTNPEVLLPGDRVFVPAIQTKNERCATGARHVFRRKGVPLRIVFALRDRAAKPFAGCRYRLEVGPNRYEGTTDADGVVRAFVAPAAEQGILTLWPDRKGYAETLTWPLTLSALDPVDTPQGIRARLRNLGIPCAAGNAPLDEQVRDALRVFQKREQLPVTGEDDETTRARLLAAHGS